MEQPKAKINDIIITRLNITDVVQATVVSASLVIGVGWRYQVIIDRSKKTHTITDNDIYEVLNNQ